MEEPLKITSTVPLILIKEINLILLACKFKMDPWKEKIFR